MTDVQIPLDNCPWLHPDGNVMVAALPVKWWGSLLGEPARLPAAWVTRAGSAEPTDFEIECYVHLVHHERARVGGYERQLLTDCMGLDGVEPEGVPGAAESGETLVGWCPGVSWVWPTEQRGQPWRKQQR